MKQLNHDDVLSILPDRDPWGHKGDFGRILLLCGSRGYTGAAALAAMGALRTGAGLVYLAVPKSIYAIEAVKLTEPVVLPLPDRDGMLCADSIDKIAALLPKMDAVLFGCGSGRRLAPWPGGGSGGGATGGIWDDPLGHGGRAAPTAEIRLGSL